MGLHWGTPGQRSKRNYCQEIKWDMKPFKKILYAFGNFGTIVSLQTFTNRIQFRYIDEIGIDVRLIGIIWFLYGIWNAINDPIMGRLSDGTRSRLGRRIPYILFGAIPLGLLFLLLWIPPVNFAKRIAGGLGTLGTYPQNLMRSGTDVWLILAYFFLMLFAFDTLWTLIVLAWTALFPEMYPDEKERADVSGWRQVFALLGLIVALALSPILIGQIGYLGMGLIFGAITTLSFLLSLLGSKENPETYQDEVAIPFMKSLKISFANPSFRWFLVASLAKEFIFLVMVAMLPFYSKYILQLEDVQGGLSADLQQALLLGVPFILAIPVMFVWTSISKRSGSRRAWMYAAIAFIPGLTIMFAAASFQVAILGTSLLVLGLPGLLMLPDLLLADIIDEDELLSGSRREGFYFGMNGAIIRLAFSLQAVIFTFLLNSSGYDPNNATQPDAALFAVRSLMAGAPMLAVLAIIVALMRYPLYGERLQWMRKQLLERK